MRSADLPGDLSGARARGIAPNEASEESSASATVVPALVSGSVRLAGHAGYEVGTWTEERVRAVCERHAAGEWLTHACAREGGVVNGLKKACEREPRYAVMLADAHARGVEHFRERMDRASREDGDWKREAWLLERFDRTNFAPPTREVQLDATTTTTHAVHVTIDRATALDVAKRGKLRQ